MINPPNSLPDDMTPSTPNISKTTGIANNLKGYLPSPFYFLLILSL